MKNREANIGAKASHTSPLTSLPASIWRLAATRPSVMTPTDIKSRENRRRRDVVGKPHQRSAQRLVVAPGDRLRGRRGTGLMNPSLQNIPGVVWCEHGAHTDCAGEDSHGAANRPPLMPGGTFDFGRGAESPGTRKYPALASVTCNLPALRAIQPTGGAGVCISPFPAGRKPTRNASTGAPQDQTQGMERPNRDRVHFRWYNSQ